MNIHKVIFLSVACITCGASGGEEISRDQLIAEHNYQAYQQVKKDLIAIQKKAKEIALQIGAPYSSLRDTEGSYCSTQNFWGRVCRFWALDKFGPDFPEDERPFSLLERWISEASAEDLRT